MDIIEFKAKLYKAITTIEDALKNNTEADPFIMGELTSSIENFLSENFLENPVILKQDFELLMMLIHFRNISKNILQIIYLLKKVILKNIFSIKMKCFHKLEVLMIY